MNFTCDISRQIIKIVKKLPKPLDFIAFSMYDKIACKIFRLCSLKTHTARAYFGSILDCHIDDFIQKHIFYFGMWEPMISYVTEQLLQEGDVYVDVGANIGYDSLLASNCVGDFGKVVSIEASPSIYSILAGNVARNSASNIRMVNMAVSDSKKTLALYAIEKYNIGMTTTIEHRGKEGSKECLIEALPIDEILSVNELNRVRLIKIDIEGAELPVLNRLVNTLTKYPDNMSIIVEASVQDDPGEWSRIFNKFQAAGFVAYEIENLYDSSWYLRYTNHSLVKLMENLPNRQVDILFTRTYLPATICER